MRVSLAQPRPDVPAAPPPPLLARSGARVILGGTAGLAEPVRASAQTLFGPRGAAMAPGGPLIVCDTGHHRVLGWSRIPTEDMAPADFVIGQPDFHSEGRRELNVPTGVAVTGGVLAVADAWNHRVLLWHGLTERPSRPPDVVVGGPGAPAADTMYWCYGVAILDGRLYVADTGNRRVLVWDRVPETSHTPADSVLGQPDFTTRDMGEMRWPHAVAAAAGRAFIADAGAGRVASPDLALGATGFEPAAGTLNMPYGVAAAGDRLIVADTANSRLLGYDTADLETGAPADRLAGQRWFHERGENRWERPGRDTLCWPYGVSACGGTAVVADTGNNRVLLWDLA